MAPPDKDVMGVRMHIKSDPPHEDDPPLQRPRAKQPSRPQVEIEPESETLESKRAPHMRKDSPVGGIRLEGKGWRITMPHVALVAVLTTIGGWFGSKAVSKGEQVELGDVLNEVRALRTDVKGLKRDVADVGEEQRSARSDAKKILAYTEDTVTPIVASLRKLGVKLQYDGDDDPAGDVEFHQPPLGGTAPPIQPKVTLPKRPNL